jgi:hypothetical protein
LGGILARSGDGAKPPVALFTFRGNTSGMAAMRLPADAVLHDSGEGKELDTTVRDALDLARSTASDEDMPVVVGWWLDGRRSAFMLVPEGHEVMEDFRFTPFVLALPDGEFVSLLRDRRALV